MSLQTVKEQSDNALIAAKMRKLIIGNYDFEHEVDCKQLKHALWRLSGIEDGFVSGLEATQGIQLASVIIVQHNIMTIVELEKYKASSERV